MDICDLIFFIYFPLKNDRLTNENAILNRNITICSVLAIKNWESNFFRQSIQKNNRLAGSILNDITGQKSKVNDNTNGFGASAGFQNSNGFGQSSIFSNPFGNRFTSGQSSSSPSEWVQQLYRMNNKRDFIR